MLPIANTRDVPWTPKQLYKAADIGAWFDARDFNTMFTDTTGTASAKITAAGNSVKRWEDKSGHGHHVTEGTAPPTWQVDFGGCVRFNGTTQFLNKTSPIDLYAAGACSVFVAVKANTAINGVLCGESNNVGSSGAYRLLQADAATASTHSGAIRNDANTLLLSNATDLQTGVFDNTTRILGAIDNGLSVTPLQNASAGTAVTYTARSGVVTLVNFTLGAQFTSSAAAFAAMDIYELILIGRVVTTEERLAVMRYLGKPRGLYF